MSARRGRWTAGQELAFEIDGYRRVARMKGRRYAFRLLLRPETFGLKESAREQARDRLIAEAWRVQEALRKAKASWERLTRQLA